MHTQPNLAPGVYKFILKKWFDLTTITIFLRGECCRPE